MSEGILGLPAPGLRRVVRRHRDSRVSCLRAAHGSSSASIAGSDLRDGMGCYPLFCCRDWTRLSHDVSVLAGQLVSFTLVTDPFGEFSLDDLRRVFDVVRPYKRHYVRDLVNDTSVPVTRRHKRNTRQRDACRHAGSRSRANESQRRVGRAVRAARRAPPPDRAARLLTTVPRAPALRAGFENVLRHRRRVCGRIAPLVRPRAMSRTATSVRPADSDTT